MECRKGLFIVVEGFEGTGKSSFVELLADELRAVGHRVINCRQPGSTPLSEKIRAAFKAVVEEKVSNVTEYLLMQACRKQLLDNVIIPEIDKGSIVICDRHTLSTDAYQGVSINGVDEHLGIKPDMTILLQADFDVCMSRVHGRGALDRMEQKDINELMKVHEYYSNIELDSSSHGQSHMVNTNQFDDAYRNSISGIFTNVCELIKNSQTDVTLCNVIEFEKHISETTGIRLIIKADVSSRIKCIEHDKLKYGMDVAVLENLIKEVTNLPFTLYVGNKSKSKNK